MKETLSIGSLWFCYSCGLWEAKPLRLWQACSKLVTFAVNQNRKTTAKGRLHFVLNSQGDKDNNIVRMAGTLLNQFVLDGHLDSLSLNMFTLKTVAMHLEGLTSF